MGVHVMQATSTHLPHMGSLTWCGIEILKHKRSQISTDSAIEVRWLGQGHKWGGQWLHHCFTNSASWPPLQDMVIWHCNIFTTVRVQDYLLDMVIWHCNIFTTVCVQDYLLDMVIWHCNIFTTVCVQDYLLDMVIWISCHDINEFRCLHII
jgi:hypothetical protein